MPQIRNFRPSDMGTIMDFTRRVVRQSFPSGEFRERSMKGTIQRHLHYFPDSIKVAEADGEIAGYVWLKVVDSSIGTYGRIEQLFVEDGHRKKGIGKMLMEAAEEYFRGKGLRTAKLTVTKGNNAALSLYRQMGYSTKRFAMEKDL